MMQRIPHPSQLCLTDVPVGPSDIDTTQLEDNRNQNHDDVIVFSSTRIPVMTSSVSHHKNISGHDCVPVRAADQKIHNLKVIECIPISTKRSISRFLQGEMFNKCGSNKAKISTVAVVFVVFDPGGNCMNSRRTNNGKQYDGLTARHQYCRCVVSQMMVIPCEYINHCSDRLPVSRVGVCCGGIISETGNTDW